MAVNIGVLSHFLSKKKDQYCQLFTVYQIDLVDAGWIGSMTSAFLSSEILLASSSFERKVQLCTYQKPLGEEH